MSNPLVPATLSFNFDFDQAYDRENPRALVNIVTKAVAEKMNAIPKQFFEMPIQEVAKKTTIEIENLDLIRTAWWMEYNRAQKTQTGFNINNVCAGICYKREFMSKYIGNSYNFLYIMTPPVDYQVHQHRIMEVGYKMELDILALPNTKPIFAKGVQIGEEVDSKLLTVKQRIIDAMRNRVLGMPINRTMQVNQNFNSPMPGNNSQFGGLKPLEQMDEGELREYITEMKGEKGIENSNPRFKDVRGKGGY